MSFATNDSATKHSAGVAITAEEIAAGEQKASDDVARYALALGDDGPLAIGPCLPEDPEVRDGQHGDLRVVHGGGRIPDPRVGGIGGAQLAGGGHQVAPG